MSLRPFAEAFEGRLRRIEALLPAGPAADGLSCAHDLSSRLLALHARLRHATAVPAVSLDRSDIDASRLDRIAATVDVGPLPEGHEPLDGARFAGFVEVVVGASIPSAFRLWCLGEAGVAGSVSPGEAAEAMADDAAALARFSQALVDHALGLLPGPMPHVGAIEGFVWYPEGLPNAPEHLAEFAEAAARAMFAEAWASNTADSLSGLDVLEAAPATPPDAILEGYRFAGRFEAANGTQVDELLEMARLADCGGDAELYLRRSDEIGGLAEAEEFGRASALSACGYGVSWFDRHAAFDLKPVRFDYAGPSDAALVQTPSAPRP